jgi:hypothetical protein
MFIFCYRKKEEFIIYGAGYSLANGKYYLTDEILNEIYVYQNNNGVQLKVTRKPWNGNCYIELRHNEKLIYSTGSMVHYSENKLTEIVDFSLTPTTLYLPCPKFQDNENLSRRELNRFNFNIVIYDADEQTLNGTYNFTGVVGSYETEGTQWFSNDDYFISFYIQNSMYSFPVSKGICKIYDNDNGAIGNLIFQNNNLHEKNNSWQEVNGNKIVNFKFYNDNYIHLLEHGNNSKINGHYNNSSEGTGIQITYHSGRSQWYNENRYLIAMAKVDSTEYISGIQFTDASTYNWHSYELSPLYVIVDYDEYLTFMADPAYFGPDAENIKTDNLQIEYYVQFGYKSRNYIAEPNFIPDYYSNVIYTDKKENLPCPTINQPYKCWSVTFTAFSNASEKITNLTKKGINGEYWWGGEYFSNDKTEYSYCWTNGETVLVFDFPENSFKWKNVQTNEVFLSGTLEYEDPIPNKASYLHYNEDDINYSFRYGYRSQLPDIRRFSYNPTNVFIVEDDVAIGNISWNECSLEMIETEPQQFQNRDGSYFSN